ncbi:MAG: transporter [Aquificae bacterium]|nr:transporter [Aquificota bacterium]
MFKKVSVLLSALALSSAVYSAAYKIPEQSTRAMGTAAAYFSSADSADASYYNPAGMVWLGNDNNILIETGAKYIYLPSIKFYGTVDHQPADGKTKKEYYVIPYLHLVSKKIGDNLRWGLSFVTPFGLSKRWDEDPQARKAKEFTLGIYELITSIAYQLDDKFSLAGGIRIGYSSGKVHLYNPFLYDLKMKGSSSLTPAFLVSASLKPSENLRISALYRSHLEYKITGQMKGNLAGTPVDTYGEVKVITPAEFRLGIAYNPLPTTVVDITYERTFWGKYKTLDFNFEDPTIEAYFGRPIPKDWVDTNTVRVGVRHKITPKITLMGGIAYDETPIPQKTLGFELPDGNGWIYSIGGLWDITNRMEVGFAYLYVFKYDRYVGDNDNGIDGKFKDMEAHLFNFSVGYKF